MPWEMILGAFLAVRSEGGQTAYDGQQKGRHPDGWRPFIARVLTGASSMA
ncbi:hypothetical protein [Streptomyces sp. NPDC058695]